jgi:hypothetical protein
MTLIDALTRLLSALAGCSALLVAARSLVSALERSRSVCDDVGDTPTQSDVPGAGGPPR